MTRPFPHNIPDRAILSMAILVALGVLLHRVEATLPIPSPWIKPGFANIMTLIALVLLGPGEALIVAVLRVLLGSMIGGTFLGPTFFLSLAGTLAATGTMIFVYRKGKGPFGLIGVSLLAAYAHGLAVTSCVYLLFVRQDSIFHLLPVLFTVALVSGLMTGALAQNLVFRLKNKGTALS